MNYIVLHIDVEFIVGAVCADNGNSYPITNGNDDLLWLYFYNDARTNKITFGKNNRDHANKEVTNYYGDFFHIITDGYTTFKRGEFQKEAIELLQYSDLLKTIKDKYADVTKENKENISTLITFSLSISDMAKQKTVAYLKTQGFTIDSYTIPLAELVAYYPYSKKEFLPANGSTILLLAATNATLHLMKLVFSDNYFMLDGEVRKYEGMGIDPRKRALVGYVINQINIHVGALNANEIPAEIEKKEFKADEWLKKLDAKAKNDNSPIRISESLSPMPSSIRDVLVKKSDIETVTNDFVNLLMDYFNAYKSDNVRGDIAGIFLLGDCFNNSLAKQRFNNLFKNDDERKKKLFAYANKDIRNILTVYPKIDFYRYINEEARSKAKAEAEEFKQTEQRLLEDRQRKEQEAEEERIATEKQLEEDRKEAEKLFNWAVTLDKAGKLEDALANIENAIGKDGDKAEYKKFLGVLKDKQNELKIRNEQYKSLLNKAEKSVQNNDLENALNVYELAKEIFDNAEIRDKILEVKEQIKNRKKQKEAVNKLFSNAESLYNQGKLEEAKDYLNQILLIDTAHSEAKAKLKAIEIQLQEIEIQYRTLIREADKNLGEKRFGAAISAYEEALKIRPNDDYCLRQMKVVTEKRASTPPPPPPPGSTNQGSSGGIAKSSVLPTTNAPKPSTGGKVPPLPPPPRPTGNVTPPPPRAVPPPPPISTKQGTAKSNVPPPSRASQLSRGGKVIPPPPPLPSKKK